MRETLTDIRDKLQHRKYKNEEHVRLSLVCRLLFKLGWDIWNPDEVNTECKASPTEDNTRVDIALSANGLSPSIFMEVKAVGKLISLEKVETQVRDYNRDHTALFSVITDGRIWRLYYCQTGGKFHDKCFKECDLLTDDLEDIEQTFSLFFGKENIESGFAEEQASKYLRLTNKQKAVQDLVPEARRLTQVSPFPSLPQAIVKLAKNENISLSETEAEEFLKPPTQVPDTKPTPPPNSRVTVNSVNEIQLLDADNLPNLRYTRVEGTIGGQHERKWKNLVKVGIRRAHQRGYDAHAMNTWRLPANIKEGLHEDDGYHPLEGLNLSVQGLAANNSANTLIKIAKKLNCQLELTVLWQKGDRAGQQGIIRWQP